MMKKILITMMVCCALTCAEAQTNLSPEVNAYLHSYKQAVKTRSADAVRQTVVTLRLKPGAQPADVASRVEALGADVKVTLGNQMTVALTGNILEQVARTEGVDIVEMLSKPAPRTDNSRIVTQADKVLSGTGEKLPQAYTGEGVIIGLIDKGYDFTHPAFKDADGKLRIKSVYLPGYILKAGKKAVIDGKEVEGTLFDTPEEILDTLKLIDHYGTHGTHCLSIAAGSEVKGVEGLSGKPLGGMAPKADIILSNSGTNKAMEDKYGDKAAVSMAESLAFKWISEYGKAQNKPVVLSWSENSHYGLHDGTSATAQTVRNFCGEGNIAVICASNEGGDSMHVHKNLNAGETLKLMIKSTEVGAESFTFFLTKKPVRMRIGVYDIVEKKEVYLSEALSSDDNVDFSINMSDKPASSLSPAQKTLHEELSKYFAGGLSIMLSSGKGKDPQGNDRQYVEAILITDQKAMKSVSNRLVIHFTPEEATEAFSWVDYTSYDKAVGYTEGTASVSMGDCSTSGEAVTVGAWAASNRLKFSQQSDNILTDRSYTVGDIAYFSSYGTDYAGHRIPDVAAPGVYVNAALNSLLSAKEVEGEIISTSMPFSNQFVGQNADRIYYWRFASGTSMATPIAAGIVALWVQAAKDKGKTLTNADVKDIILHSSDTDEGTAKAPHRFGAGKINAYRGLLYVLDLSTGIEGLSQQQPENVSFRVENGQLIAEGAEDGTAVTLYNLSGTIVSRTAVHAGRISLDGLRKGVYAVQLGKLGSTLIRL